MSWSGLTHDYFYMDLDHGTPNLNEVVRIVVEDYTQPDVKLNYNSGWQVLEERNSTSENTLTRIATAKISIRLVAALHRRRILCDENTDSDSLCV